MRKNKNSIIKKVIITNFFVLIVNLINGQANYSNYYFPEPPKAPSSEAFLKYGGVQNSEYSGSNNPSIGLFNLQSGNISLPVNLNYISGNGIKVTDEASQVGLGWSMSFPTIVQNIYGYDDFSSTTRFRLDFAKSTLPYANSFPIESGPTNFNQYPSFDTYGYFMATNNNVPRGGSFNNVYSNFATVDMQPDIFILNLFGEKVEFTISNFGNYNPAVVQSLSFDSLNKKGYVIKRTTEGFTVKDPKGFTYKFNNIEKITASIPGGLQGQNFLITEITDTNSNTIYFDYLNISNVDNPAPKSWFLNYTKAFSRNKYTITTNDLELAGSGDTSSYTNPNGFNNVGGLRPTSSDNGGSKQNYLLPLNITSSNGKLTFTYSDRVDFGTKKLEKISLYTYNSILVNECQFGYDYFSPQQSDVTPLTYDLNRNKRLKLISLQKTNEEKYSFVYNETLLPHKYSYATDYWGYSNGGFNNKTAHLNPNDFNYNVNIPVISNPTTGYTEFNNNNKLPNVMYAKSAILERITYPTKGYSVFDYEENEASNLFVINDKYKYTKGNGLRLRTHKNYDINNNLLSTTQFEYENGITPNPKKVFRQDNAEVYVTANQCVLPIYDICDVETMSGSFVSMSSNSVSNTYTLSSGSGVGYSKVIRKELDVNGNTKGRIESTYSNSEDVHFYVGDYNRPIFLPSVKGNKKENGVILNKLVFDSNNVKLNEEKYNYTVQNSNYSYGVVMIHPMFQKLKIDHGTVEQYVIKSAIGYYPIYSTETILKDTETIEYINGNSLSTKTDYIYDGYNFVSNKTTTYPTLETMSEQYKYSHQNPRFYQANILAKQFEKSVVKTPRLIFKQIDQYSDLTHFNPTTTTIQDLNTGFTGIFDVTYDKYDNKGNLLQYTKKGGAIFTVIWGYNQTQPIAIIEGATYPDPNNPKPTDIPQSLITSIVNASNTDAAQPTGNDETAFLTVLDNFKNDPLTANFKITTYTYDPLIGIRSITSSSGNREFYRYDISTNKLEKILDQDNNVVKEYKQKFAPTKYYNSTRNQTFTRNNCGSSSIGGSYTYTVPENKYSSYDSQANADQQAQTEINNLGQSTANSQGTCTPINCSVSMNNTPGGGGVSVLYPDYKVQLSFSSGVGRPWTTDGVLVAKINGSCRPTTEITRTSYSGGFIWSILIRTNGELLVKKLEGLGVSGVPNNTTYNLEFTFPIN